MCQTYIVSTATPCFQVVSTPPGACPYPGSSKYRHQAQGHPGPGMCGEVSLPKPVSAFFPHRAREDDLGVQMPNDEQDPDQKTPSFEDFYYHYI